MDEIFVNNYIKEIEIGAFQSERGCKQRVEFNVNLKVEPLSKVLNDDVDRVLSYEVITEAINNELQRQRFNLLETLAENIADQCLREARVLQANVKIEKLDRISGSLGVSISRIQGNKLSFENVHYYPEELEKFSLISFSSAHTNSDLMLSWISKLKKSDRPVVITVGPDLYFLKSEFDHELNLSIKNTIGLLSMDQSAWIIHGLDRRLPIASSKAELNWALQSKKVSLFCPSQFVRQSLSVVPQLSRKSKEFYRWLATELKIKNLYLVGPDYNNRKFKENGINVRYLNIGDWNSFR